MVSTLTNNYLSGYNQILMDNLTETMKSLEVAKYFTSSDMGSLLTTHLCIGEQTVVSYSVREENSQLWIDEETNSLKLRVSGISLTFGFDFKVWSDPEWLHDEGTGVVTVYDCDMSMMLELFNDLG